MKRQAEYKSFLKFCPEITSDYSFVNLWSWKDIYALEWAWDENLVWIRQQDPELIYWAPIGDWNKVLWTEAIEPVVGKEANFTRIPNYLAEVWQKELPGQISLDSNMDHWDYVYSVQELINLSGNRFHKKKNLLKQFEKLYNYEYLELELKHIEQALTLQTEWCLWRDCEESSTLEAENQAILNTLESWSQLEGVFGAGLRVDGHMIAFTIAEPLDQDNLVIHFEKGCPKHKGVYQAINQKFLKSSASNFNYVNREQDLGDPGLRKAKQSYNPVSFLKKHQGRFQVK